MAEDVFGRRGGRRRRRRKTQEAEVGLTLAHAADATRRQTKESARLPKALRGAGKALGEKQLQCEHEEAEDGAIDGQHEPEDQEEADNDVIVSHHQVQNGGRRRRRKRDPRPAMDGGGELSFPFDFWELLAGYVHPESVRAFSMVCRGARAAVQRELFWRRLYLNAANGNWPDGMPDELKPDYVLARRNRRNLRTLVIRSLHYTYPPFVARVARHERDAHAVKGGLLVRWWEHRMAEKHYAYCFQFQMRPTPKRVRRRPTSEVSVERRPSPQASMADDEAPDRWDEDNNSYNESVERRLGLTPGPLRHLAPDEHHSLLVVSTNMALGRGVPPSALGMRLVEVLLAVSVEQSLCLGFAPSHRRDRHCPEAVGVAFGRVRSVHVFPWHFPQYVAVCGHALALAEEEESSPS